MNFKSVKRRKIHEDVAEQIEDQILSGGLQEGANLPSERSLMEAFNVGRPAVREALIILQRGGFIEVSSNGRPIVARPTATNVLEQLSGSARFLLSSKDGERSFQDARRLFEAAIARNAAEIATPKDIERIGAALRKNRKAIGNANAFELTDVEFHLAIANTGDNSVFMALHAAIAEWLSMQRKVSLRVPGVEARAYKSHEEIYGAIVAHQPETAWRAMDQHLRDIIEAFQKGSQHGDV
ncbi:MAG: FCD domain-containing protein [Rhodobacteraceae bacterium]|jgi:GntR family transcriptional regulator, sialic acid-inducible nan operon repressor|nr:FCD domain-containing protein [Paracoccaceae bacterium]